MSVLPSEPLLMELAEKCAQHCFLSQFKRKVRKNNRLLSLNHCHSRCFLLVFFHCTAKYCVLFSGTELWKEDFARKCIFVWTIFTNRLGSFQNNPLNICNRSQNQQTSSCRTLSLVSFWGKNNGLQIYCTNLARIWNWSPFS